MDNFVSPDIKGSETFANFELAPPVLTSLSRI